MGKKIWMPVLLLLVICGCYQYDRPQTLLLGDKFTSENRSATDAMLLEMSRLELDAAKRIAELNNQSYIAIYHAVDGARMRYYQSMGAFSPEIYVGASVGQPMKWASNMVNPPMNMAGREIGFQSTATVGASWLLFDGLARYFSMRIAESQLEREGAMQARELCMLRRAVAYAYYDIQLAEELQRIQHENIAFQEELGKLTQTMYEKKERYLDEVVNFSVIADFSRTDLLQSQYMEEIANYTLARLMGYSEGVLPSSLKNDPLDYELKKIYYSQEMCLDIALEKSPEMHIMYQNLKTAEYNKFKSYSSFFPRIYALFEYNNQTASAKYRDFRHTNSSYTQNGLSYALSGEYTVFNGFARYNRMREMQSLFAAAEFQMAETYLQIVNAIRAAYEQYVISQEKALVYRRLMVQSREQRDLVLDRYRLLNASVNRLDRVQLNYIDAQLRYANTVADFHKSIAQLEAIMCVDVYLQQDIKVKPLESKKPVGKKL